MSRAGGTSTSRCNENEAASSGASAGKLSMRYLHSFAMALAALAVAGIAQGFAQSPERRFALVIGNAEYKAGRLPTGANDAGLVAEALRTAGFDVTGARDLDQDAIRQSFREFLGKVEAAGADAVTFVYLAGYGMQFGGDNYIVPVDADIARVDDIPIQAVRVSDLVQPLSGLPGAVKMIVIDAARQTPFAPAGPPLASGLAMVEPSPGMLVAFNASPGSIVPVEDGPYGAFAQALTEMIGTGGLSLDDVFTRVRLRVSQKTNGVEVPWYVSKVERPFLFLERAPNAPAPPNAMALPDVETRPMSDFGGDREAYAAALARDTLRGYEEFLAAFPDSPLAPRVGAIVAVRREAITWRRTWEVNTPDAYWSYLRRYPAGAHVPDAQRRLALLAAAFEPPPVFTPIDYDIGPPLPDEVEYLDQPEILFGGLGFAPPPPIPDFFLPPPSPDFDFIAPPPPVGPFFLPAPVVPFFAAAMVRPPPFVSPPPAAPIQEITINNTTIVNERGGGARSVSAALPAAVVTRVNSGRLRVPPAAGPPPSPVRLVERPQGKKPVLPPGAARLTPNVSTPVVAPRGGRPPQPSSVSASPQRAPAALASPPTGIRPPPAAVVAPQAPTPRYTSPGLQRRAPVAANTNHALPPLRGIQRSTPRAPVSGPPRNLNTANTHALPTPGPRLGAAPVVRPQPNRTAITRPAINPRITSLPAAGRGAPTVASRPVRAAPISRPPAYQTPPRSAAIRPPPFAASRPAPVISRPPPVVSRPPPM